MKQLQWDKLPHQQVGKTLLKDEEPEKEKEILAKLQSDGVWMEMEKDFKAKQLMINLMARQKQAELKSVLDPQTKKRVEILMKRVKKNMTSTEFFAVFETFVISYKKCTTENQTAAEEKAAVEKRKQAMAESRQLRRNLNAKDAGPKEEDDAVLDNLLEKLRSGDTVTRRAGRGRPKPDTRPIIPPLDTATPFDTTAPLDTVDVARDIELPPFHSNSNQLTDSAPAKPCTKQ
ncbi:hypothetical protein M405DRAFT_507493 [Rhizopogon salebrosus TDB-379]|nr:hypothetical protein M405DRAFT_507493 [Rhizopogon salebrosus TDB-379]